MLIVVKLILVAFAVFGQTKLFPERSAESESSLDSLDLSSDQPELVLAKRAMAAQGLCHAVDKAAENASAGSAGKSGSPDPFADSVGPANPPAAGPAPESDEEPPKELATNCF